MTTRSSVTKSTKSTKSMTDKNKTCDLQHRRSNTASYTNKKILIETCDLRSLHRSLGDEAPRLSANLKQVNQESEESDGETLHSEDASHDSDFSEHSSDLDFIDDSEVVEYKRDTIQTKIRSLGR
tara:strand:+ start:618 stop:992 length:375 start_codon:yes stop_codon:yes gene_type:complete